MKVAVVQSGPVLFDTGATLEKLSDLAADAAREGASLAVFPEAFVGGYPKGADFGARLGMRDRQRRQEFARYHACAIDRHGPEIEIICETARRTGMHLVVGVIERCGGTLYCVAATLDAAGAIVGWHRKLVPTGTERLIWGRGDAFDVAAATTEIGTIGAAICWENYLPLYRAALYSQNVDIYCAPTVDDRDTWAPLMRTIACEGRCFTISACQFLTRADIPSDFPVDLSGYSEDPQTPVIRGGSCAYGPLGDELLAPCEPKECIRTVEIDGNARVAAQFDLDVAGHSGRPDIFSLVIREPMRATAIARGTPASEKQQDPGHDE